MANTLNVAADDQQGNGPSRLEDPDCVQGTQRSMSDLPTYIIGERTCLSSFTDLTALGDWVDNSKGNNAHNHSRGLKKYQPIKKAQVAPRNGSPIVSHTYGDLLHGHNVCGRQATIQQEGCADIYR